MEPELQMRDPVGTDSELARAQFVRIRLPSPSKSAASGGRGGKRTVVPKEKRGREVQSHLLFEILAVPFLAGVYSWLRGQGVFRNAHQWAGAPGGQLEVLLLKADAYAAGIVIISALLCALGAIVVAVWRGESDAPLACCLIATSGLLCRTTLPLSGRP
jgi:hypothetical protein